MGKKTKGIWVNCFQCGQTIRVNPTRIKRSKSGTFFCGYHCSGKWKIANKIAGSRPGSRPKGLTFKGRKHTNEVLMEMKERAKRGEQHPGWKGNGASYNVKHKWVKNNFGKPNECSMCHSKSAKRYEWANKSGNYKREKDDWLRLCTKCHHKYDEIHEKAAITRRRQGYIQVNNSSGYIGIQMIC